MSLPGTSSLFNTTTSILTSNTNNSDNNNSDDNNANNVSWKGWEDILKLLPGPSFEEEQSVSNNSIYFNKSIYIYIYYIL